MLTENQKMGVARIFAIAESEKDFDERLKRLGVVNALDIEEASRLIFAIATNKPVPKQR